MPSPSPICVACSAQMRVAKNDVPFIFLDDEHEPYAAANYDKWECPLCGNEILTGAGNTYSINRQMAQDLRNYENAIIERS